MSALHRLKAKGAIPGSALRILLFLVIAGSAFVLLPATWLRFVPAILAVAAAIYPSSLCAWLALALLPIGMLASDSDPWRASAAVFAVHAIHILAAQTLAIPARARVQLRALLPTGIRFLWIQALSQAVVLIMLLLMPNAGIGFAWLAPVGAAALLGLAALLLKSLTRYR